MASMPVAVLEVEPDHLVLTHEPLERGDALVHPVRLVGVHHREASPAVG